MKTYTQGEMENKCLDFFESFNKKYKENGCIDPIEVVNWFDKNGREEWREFHSKSIKKKIKESNPTSRLSSDGSFEERYEIEGETYRILYNNEKLVVEILVK